LGGGGINTNIHPRRYAPEEYSYIYRVGKNGATLYIFPKDLEKIL